MNGEAQSFARSHGSCAVIDLQVKIGLVVVCVMVIGFLNICRVHRCVMRDKEFAKSFRTRFAEYINSRCCDRQAYEWLITNSPRMQSEIDGDGLTQACHIPYKQVVYPTSPVILMAIPKIRRVAKSPALKRILYDHAHMVTDALMRHLGSLDEAERACRAARRNPLVWLREGNRILFAVPFNLLYWFGILGSETVSRITASHAFKAVAGMVGLMGIVATVFGLIVDAPEAWPVICSWLGL